MPPGSAGTHARRFDVVLFISGGPVPVNLLAFLADAVPKFNPMDSGSTVDDHIQFVYQWVFWVSVVIGIGVSGALLYAFVKFRRRSDDEEPEQVHGSNKLEWAWTITPYLILMVLFVISALNMEYIRQAPTAASTGKKAVDVTVIGQQFSWTYVYTGQRNKSGHDISTATTMVVPADTPVVLHIVSTDAVVPDPTDPHNKTIPSGCSADPTGTDGPSADLARRMAAAPPAASTADNISPLATAIAGQGCGVNHSFFIPALAGQVNAIPGQVNYLWFDAKEGDYLGQCTELCGSGHANMLIEIKALNPKDYALWLNQQVSK